MGDVERLQHEMRTRLEVQGRTLRADIARLRTEGETLRAMLAELGVERSDVDARIVAALLEQARG